jgi:hypothetical protein
MPRPNLGRAQALVRAFCIENGFAYREESIINSYRQTVRQLRLAANIDVISVERASVVS